MTIDRLSESYSPSLTDYLYNGKELDSDFNLGWYHYGARLYNPATARFTGVDPIADQFAELSPFNYASNEPIRNIDLHGLQGVDALAEKIVGTDQKGLIRTATPLMRETQPGRAAVADGTAFILAPLNVVDNFVTDMINPELSGGEKLDIVKDAARAGILSLFTRRSRLKSNKAAGKKAEELTTNELKKEFPNDEVKTQVTGKFDDGTKTRFDNVVIDSKTGKPKLMNETKSGNAQLSKQQKRFHNEGESVTLTGKNAGTAAGKKVNTKNTQTRTTRVKREDLD